jgi:hypothetical protein
MNPRRTDDPLAEAIWYLLMAGLFALACRMVWL